MLRLFKNPCKGKLPIFVASALISVILLGLFQATIYYINGDIREKEIKRIQHNLDISWKIVESIINEAASQAKRNLLENVSPNIVKDINSVYKDNMEKLKEDLDNLKDIEYTSDIVHILADNIRDEYFNDIKTDANSMFVLMKKFGVISDFSITASSEIPRNVENEIRRSYNKELARQAFDAILEQKYYKKYIFWQWNEPDAKFKKFNLDIMDISQLEKIFKESGGDIESLKTIEFLVPEYIFMDRDILGNPLVDDRGMRQSIYQFIIVQRFNVYEIIQNDEFKMHMFKVMIDNNELSELAVLTNVQKISSFVVLFCVLYILISATKIKERFFDDK